MDKLHDLRMLAEMVKFISIYNDMNQREIILRAFRQKFNCNEFFISYIENRENMDLDEGLDTRATFIFELLEQIQLDNKNLQLIAAIIEMLLYIVAPPMFTDEEIKEGTIFENNNSLRVKPIVTTYYGDEDR